jgi:hypothetical protein
VGKIINFRNITIYIQKSGKKNFHEQVIDMFTKMVENNTIMVNVFEEPMFIGKS